jgi:hypothetical protein
MIWNEQRRKAPTRVKHRKQDKQMKKEARVKKTSIEKKSNVQGEELLQKICTKKKRQTFEERSMKQALKRR